MYEARVSLQKWVTFWTHPKKSNFRGFSNFPGEGSKNDHFLALFCTQDPKPWFFATPWWALPKYAEKRPKRCSKATPKRGSETVFSKPKIMISRRGWPQMWCQKEGPFLGQLFEKTGKNRFFSTFLHFFQKLALFCPRGFGSTWLK